MAGPNAAQPSSLFQPSPHLHNVNQVQDLSDLTIGVFWEWLEDASSEVVDACKAQLHFLQSRGAKV